MQNDMFCRCPAMARGALNGSFYVPAGATYVRKLKVPLSDQSEQLMEKFNGTYHAEFADAVFAAVFERLCYDDDNFVVDREKDPMTSLPLKNLGEIAY